MPTLRQIKGFGDLREVIAACFSDIHLFFIGIVAVHNDRDLTRLAPSPLP